MENDVAIKDSTSNSQELGGVGEKRKRQRK
jgi:hypothetical protein